MTHLLSIILFLPLLCGLVVLAIPRDRVGMARAVAFGGALLELLLVVLLFVSFDPRAAGFQFDEYATWIPTIGAGYDIAVDGISVGLVLLTSFLTPLLIFYVNHRGEGASGSLLFTILSLETALLGVLLSVDVLLFYVFWEAMLIPMYFLLAVWGGERRSTASLKFILYMMIGSLLMLAGILWFYWWQHVHGGTALSFNLADWVLVNSNPASRIPHAIQMVMFFFFFFSFAIKVPLFPFHSWLPDAQAEGPLAFNVLLVEVGAYAFVRFCLTLFPDASLTWAPIIMTLAVINVIYGAVMAIVQTDLKRLFAYASMSHAGFIMLGIYSMTMQGLQGAVLYMINSGITSAALFVIADLLYRRRQTREIRGFGGLARPMPLLYFFFMVVALGAIGLPGLNGFPSEFLCLLGGIRTRVASPQAGYWAGAGVVLSAIYMLWMFQRVMYGTATGENARLEDLDGAERTTLWPIALVIFLLGWGSAVLTLPMRGPVNNILFQVRQGGADSDHALPQPENPTEWGEYSRTASPARGGSRAAAGTAAAAADSVRRGPAAVSAAASARTSAATGSAGAAGSPPAQTSAAAPGAANAGTAGTATPGSGTAGTAAPGSPGTGAGGAAASSTAATTGGTAPMTGGTAPAATGRGPGTPSSSR